MEIPTNTRVDDVDTSTVRRAERPVTVKLPVGDIQCLQGFALLENTTVAEQIRIGIDDYIDKRLNSDSLQNEVQSARERNEATFTGLFDQAADDSAEPASSETAPKPRSVQRPLTLRVGSAQFRLLTALALVDGGTLADQVRQSVSNYLATRLSSPLREGFDKLQNEQAEVLSV